MKITGVRTVLYEVELDRPIADVNRPGGLRRLAQLAVFLDTDEDVTGVSIGAPGTAGAIQRMTADLLTGRDPRGVRGLWKRMVDAVFKGGNRGAAAAAISALDIAMWDAKAKAAGEPLWKTLGASSRRVRAYASGLDLALDDKELAHYYRRQAARGIRAGKLKIGLDPEADLRRIGIMRDALEAAGGPVSLMIDVNEYWSPKQAIRRMRDIEAVFDITWIEEPARRWDVEGLAQVSRGVRAAVATGENLREPQEFAPLIRGRAVDVVEAGGGASGITGALMIADLAYAFDLPFAQMNCPGNYLAHIAAALPNHLMMEVVDAGFEGPAMVDSRVEGGWILLGDSPGLGLTFDPDVLRRLTVDEPSAEARMMGWGRRQGGGLLEVGLAETPEQDE